MHRQLPADELRLKKDLENEVCLYVEALKGDKPIGGVFSDVIRHQSKFLFTSIKVRDVYSPSNINVKQVCIIHHNYYYIICVLAETSGKMNIVELSTPSGYHSGGQEVILLTNKLNGKFRCCRSNPEVRNVCLGKFMELST